MTDLWTNRLECLSLWTLIKIFCTLYLFVSVNNTGTSEAHMFLIQPTNGTKEGFEALERKLPSVDFEAVFKKMKIEFGNILLPRMKMEFSQNLQPHFSSMG